MHAVPSLLLVDIGDAVTPVFFSFLRALHAIGRVDRIILDEAHLLLTAAYYSKELPAINSLRQVHVPFVCMTGTLPPFASFELEKQLYMTQCERLRASSNRPNLEYRVQSIDPAKPGLERNQSLLEYAESACMQCTRQWSLSRESSQPSSDPWEGARGICFVRNKDLGDKLAKALRGHFYHDGLPHLDRGRVVLAWNEGTASNE